MNNELQAILNYMERDRGIDREILIKAVENALQSAARHSVTGEKDVRIAIDRETYDIRAFAERLIVDQVDDPKREMTLEDAHRLDPALQLGDIGEIEVSTANLGRIAAQTAKQAIMQRLRAAERDIVFEEYKDREGDIVSGTVRQFNRSDIIVDLGRAEALLPTRERVPTEEYQIGDRIRAYILSVAENPNGPAIQLSRSHPDFVRRLFEIEVAEIADGVVEIKAIAREAGYRTKIAVISHDEKIDPVGACVGMRGMRVKNIVRELSGEKIDIIRFSEDVRTYVINALSPAKLSKIEIDETPPQTIRIVADADQLSLAIGKRGQNVRLSAKLIGWKIDIERDEADIPFAEKVARAVDALAAIDGISHDQAAKLVQAGYLSLDGILAVKADDLAETADLTPDEAAAVYAAAEGAQQEA